MNERIFISYKRADKERVFALKDSIEQATGEKCWIDLDGIESDAQFVDVIMNSIDNCEVFLFMRSAEHNKITNHRTDWTIREVNYALGERKRIVFVALDNSPLPRWFKFMFPNQQEIDSSDSIKLKKFYDDLIYWLNIAKTNSEEIAYKQLVCEETNTVNGVSFTMIKIDGGDFTMGSTQEQVNDAYEWESPPHLVTLSDYMIGETPVTQALWLAVMGSNPSNFSGLWNPVENVSWDDCQIFIEKLNKITNRNFRLPTEAEWEFAARGGNKSKGYKYAGSNTLSDVAWYGENSNETTHPVKQKLPNELGLYDMNGNVCEWCLDYLKDYNSTQQTNPMCIIYSPLRACRGGSWANESKDARVSYRYGSTPHSGLITIGLRLAHQVKKQQLLNNKVKNLHNGHEFVDLGLSVKWATCNIGASKPEEYGDYFAWGEISPKNEYDIKNYKWSNGKYDGITKYCANLDFGIIDNQRDLDLADDVVHIKWGGKWRIPTKEELIELIEKCIWKWIIINGICGYEIMSKKTGHSIFIPAAGYKSETTTHSANTTLECWSQSVDLQVADSACCLGCDANTIDFCIEDRSVGLSIRPVCTL